MRPEPLMCARTSRAARSCSCASPEPPSVTTSVSVRPIAFTTPLPDIVTAKLSPSTPAAPIRPLPLNATSPRVGTVTSTRIGVSVVTTVPPPLSLQTTSFPPLTRVVTRSRRLSSACTTTDCSPPTLIITSLLPASSTPSNGGSSRVSLAGTPEPSMTCGLPPTTTQYRADPPLGACAERLPRRVVERRQREGEQLADALFLRDRRVPQPLHERTCHARAHRRHEMQPVRRQARAQDRHFHDERTSPAKPADPLDHLPVGQDL